MQSNSERATKRNGVADWFVLSTALILSITGLAKIISAFGHSTILVTLDPIVGIRFKYLMIVVGFVEVTISCVCLYTGKSKLAMALTAWLSTLFFGYRIGLWWLGWKIPCQCMGNFVDALHIPPQTADTAMKIILAYLLIGSYATLFWLWRQKRKTSSLTPPAESTV